MVAAPATKAVVGGPGATATPVTEVWPPGRVKSTPADGKVTAAVVSVGVRVTASTAVSVTVKVATPVDDAVAVGGVTVAWLPGEGVRVTVSPGTRSVKASRSVTATVDWLVPSAGTDVGVADVVDLAGLGWPGPTEAVAVMAVVSAEVLTVTGYSFAGSGLVSPPIETVTTSPAAIPESPSTTEARTPPVTVTCRTGSFPEVVSLTW